jgi:hypothetical protein
VISPEQNTFEIKEIEGLNQAVINEELQRQYEINKQKINKDL